MERNDKQKKATLRSAILLLLLIAILLISSTYAWFIANQTVTVSTIDVNIAAKNGLQISTDGTTWKTIITNADITAGWTGTSTSSLNQLPASMEPVSTIGEIDSSTGYMKMYYGTVAANGSTGIYELTASAAGESASNNKFVAFDIFLRVDTASNLYLTNLSTVTPKSTTSIVNGNEVTTTNDTGIKNAARVAFCVEGTVPSGSTIDQMSAEKGAVSHGESGSTVYIWEPNYDAHTAAAVANANDSYSITTLTSGTGNTRQKYFGIKDAIGTAIPISQTYTYDVSGTATDPSSTYFEEVVPDYATTVGQTAYTPVFSLPAGITKVRVYMWIEGQDVDCENVASGANLLYNLQFSLLSSAS